MALHDAKPHPKAASLARGERRYRRKVASPKQWAAIRAEKLDGQTCRICEQYGGQHFVQTAPLQLHHIVPRDMHGDDVPDNLVCVCSVHHTLIESKLSSTLALLAESLTDAERDYCATKLGPNAFERLFGVQP